MTAGPLRCSVRRLREQANLQQKELAARVGVSRQALGAIESGQTVPSTLVALALARTLNCRVEDLFSIENEAPGLEAQMASGRWPCARVAVGLVGGRWVAHPLGGEGGTVAPIPADALIAGARRGRRGHPCVLSPLREVAALQNNLLVAGCDPALSLLAGHLGERNPASRLHWIEMSSEAALDALARGQVHVAGLHLFDVREREFNLPTVRRRFRSRAMLVVNLAVWETGLASRPSRGRGVEAIAEIAAGKLRFVTRERGSGTRDLIDRLLGDIGLAMTDVRVAATVHGHQAVAQAIATGAAEAGVCTRAAAAAYGLAFTPLAEDRFDLVFPLESVRQPAIGRMLETLSSLRFRKDAGALVGYGTAKTGQVVARLEG